VSRERPTILQIIPELDTGGAELSTIEIADAIVKGGGRAIVLSEGGRLAPRLAACGAEFVPFPAASKNPATVAVNAARIASIIRKDQVDLVHARSRAPAWSAYWAAQRTKRPFVTTYHGAYGEKNRFKKAYNEIMAKGDLVIANSGYTADLIRARYSTPSERLRIIHRGVDGAAFDPAAIGEDRTAKLRKAWGIDANACIILNAARLTSWKGQGVIIDAARLLQQQGKLGNAIVVLAGDAQGRDDYKRTLESQIDAAGLTGSVRLVGHVEDMAAALKLAHVTVVASTEPEAFGRAATEAQVMGCPVIATKIGAPPETVLATPDVADHATTGWLIPPSDPHALAAALAEVLSLDVQHHRDMGRRARTHVLANFTLRAMRSKTLAVYDTLLGTALHSRFVTADPQGDG
jgi:glycosyltransferase involved in cell wall biosynthesis